MIRRGFRLGLALVVGAACAAHSQGVTIDHKAVACIVAGKYPRMNACFTPTADLARSRVYFRPEGVKNNVADDDDRDKSCAQSRQGQPEPFVPGAHTGAALMLVASGPHLLRPRPLTLEAPRPALPT